MPRAEIPGDVKVLRGVKVCADCGKPVTNGGGHIHKRFAPVRFADSIDTTDLPKLRHHWLEQLKEELLSDEVMKAAGAESSRQHHFRPHDHITRTLFEAALSSIPIEGEGGS